MKIAEEKGLEKLQQEFQKLKERVKNYEQQFEAKVQEHPVASVGIAFGAGVALGALVGFLMNRRR